MRGFRILLAVVTILFLGAACSNLAQPGNRNPAMTITPTPTSPSKPFVAVTRPPVNIPTSTPLPNWQPFHATGQNLEVFIRVPQGKVPNPYVIISGYQFPLMNSEAISISGSIQGKSFFCPTSPCNVEFPESANITFQAQDKNNSTTEPIQANIKVDHDINGYSLTIVALGKFYVFTDSCENAWQTKTINTPAWARFFQDPSVLNTNKNLSYLFNHLSTTGVVNTSDCPGGGFENNLPNACRLARIRDQMTDWQNQYDQVIWQTSKDEHIPPLILKTLLETESQFWPNSQRMFLDELGLGQVNQLGIDVLLRSNKSVYQRTCSSVLSNCDIPYVTHSDSERALIRGRLAQSMDATCPTCSNGIDLNRANKSIPIIAQVLYANCLQAKTIMDLYNVTANYEDSWKLTLVSYHSGYGCLQDAVERSAFPGSQIDWNTVSANLTCTGAADYVEKFWGSLLSFNNDLGIPSNPELIKLQNPTAVPTLPRSSSSSSSRIIVKIFYDQNGDNTQQADEALNNVVVNLDLENGISSTQITSNGMASFDLSGVSVGVRAQISLPGLYRSASVIVPASGDVPIIFIFSKPAISAKLP